MSFVRSFAQARPVWDDSGSNIPSTHQSPCGSYSAEGLLRLKKHLMPSSDGFGPRFYRANPTGQRVQVALSDRASRAPCPSTTSGQSAAAPAPRVEGKTAQFTCFLLGALFAFRLVASLKNHSRPGWGCFGHLLRCSEWLSNGLLPDLSAVLGGHLPGIGWCWFRACSCFLESPFDLR